MLELGAIVIMVFVAWAVLAAGMMLLKLLVTVLLLPLRLLLSVLLLPFLLLKTVIGGVVTMVVLPIVAIAGAAALLALSMALIVPLLPLALVAFGLWFVLRAGRRPAIA
jgi:hypothetical protein